MRVEGTARSAASSEPVQAAAFHSSDIEAILRANGWLIDRATEEQAGWMAEAAMLLRSQAADREVLAQLLALIFEYDAQVILRSQEAHLVLAREGAREVIRELAHLVLEGGDVNSDRFKELIVTLKTRVRWRSRELFQPIRLALAGRSGEGELDRVILLCDSAARLPFAVPVKSVRQRLLEFCAALD